MSFPYLHLRSNSYYVPQDLQKWFPSPEIKRSLKTTDKKSAKLLATKWASKVDSLFTQIRSAIFSDAQVQDLIEKSLAFRTPAPSLPAIPLSVSIPSIEHPKPAIESKPVSQVIEEFLKEHKLPGKWRDKTAEEMTRSTTMFVKVMGDSPIREIDRKAMVDYIEKLSRLPANMSTLVVYRGKSIEQILTMNVTEPMSTASVNKYLSRVNCLMIWAVRQGYIDRNPADGLHVTNNATREDEERSTYSLEDIKTIKKALEALGRDKPERYWLTFTPKTEPLHT